jgi:hypothetical protein
MKLIPVSLRSQEGEGLGRRDVAESSSALADGLTLITPLACSGMPRRRPLTRVEQGVRY